MTFPEGIIGFEHRKRFALVEKSDGSPFRWLVSLEDSNLAFVVVIPTEFMNDYRLELPPAVVEKLGMKDQGEPDVVVLAIVTVPRNPAEMTANLRGPVVINVERRLGYQVIVDRDTYSSRHEILEEIRRSFAGRSEAATLAVAASGVSA